MTIHQAAVEAPDPRAAAAALAESDLRALELRLRLDAWADGYRAGAADEFERGYQAAVADVKAAEHALYDYLRQLPTEGERWAVRGEPRIRATFGHPHPGDYPGGALAGYSGLVWLAGPVVHRHRPCTDACRAYKPGWYTPADASAILAALPGAYPEAAA